jgi:Uma2 family endonuclease
VAPPAAAQPPTPPDPEPVPGSPELDDDGDDPFDYGHRWEPAPDGSGKLRQVPLTYADLLSPEVGDFVAEDTVHRKVTVELAEILERRYADDVTVAVWSDLKISFRIPGLTTGPGPDVCVVEGVEDRDRYRRSFRYGKEPGKVVLTVEVVSQKSVRKDYLDILAIYDRLRVEEYLAIRPLGNYSEGPFELKAWRRDPRTERLEPIASGPRGRLRLRTVGLLVGTGPDGWGLKIWDAETEEILRSPLVAETERALQAEERAEREAAARRQAEERAEREAEARRQAQERAEREAEARRQAEEQKRQAEEQIRKMSAEIEKLRSRLDG